MTERDLTLSMDDTHRTAQPVERSAMREANLSGSQGTKTVRGTWSSEGEAGRHHRAKAKPAGTPSPRLVQPRLDRIAEQARQLVGPTVDGDV